MAQTITVVGLGSGDPDQLTLGVWRRLQEAGTIYVRTERHPVMSLLREHQLAYTSFDSVYEQHDTFPEVYDTIADTLVRKAQEASAPILYAVPGHPMVAERTVQLLRERCSPLGITLEIIGGESFLDQAFTRLGIDPIEGFALLDAADLKASHVQPRVHTIIGQVYDAYTASDVKLALMERYPDDYEVVVGHALGVTGEEQILKVPLYELDRTPGFGNLSLIWVPRTEDDAVLNRTFDRLHEIVAILRSPEGCPWDREQTHQSIRKNFIEELYEALEAIDNDDPDHMREEFGDVILQVMLHSQMEEETGAFSVYDVIESLNEKLIFRHPHVFGDRSAGDASEALGNWEQMKAEEKKRKGEDDARKSQLDGIPKDLPALMKAYHLQKKAAKVGFDWDELEPVLTKIEEELRELREAIDSKDSEEQAGELGDLLFAVVNASRFIHADPEEALSRTNAKFKSRFSYIEEQLRINGKTFDQTDLTEMDRWWEEAKRQ
ncbi:MULTISPECIES: nucleoside triphosphate pyrophosphohydrolase [unclassified Paenibacillus]|uniref:nucleoside triphosphate pyrophosphohydrolase n=1 Tax=unclassified Paenibacillus TaxID=185978 RepID=UPI001053A09E|nr:MULTISPECIES: nucleoside triphosphate pyrophosphohydrolase [unclassified Paenibacillus]NIK72187.1 tetrapyrrole methylase family protein/MazG family protein [Paenibacillus sp. BK720]TCM88643.1 tetrapyrrole methylase family protein/MazG family protein [Paenibacillus sp. BK033]